MSTPNRVQNTGPNELVFTQDGRILEGFTSAIGDLSDRVTARLVSAGQLVVVQTPPVAKKTTTRSASKTSMIQTPPSGDNLEGA